MRAAWIAVAIGLALAGCARRGAVGLASQEQRLAALRVASAEPAGGPRPLIQGWGERNGHVGYVYVDHQAGPSFQTTLAVGGQTAQAIVRLGHGVDMLTEERRIALGLPDVPPWLADYGSQAPAGTWLAPWRHLPTLSG